jgi:prophage regulatory protein
MPSEPLLLTRAQVSELIAMSARWINRAVSAGEFPAPLKLGTASRWRRDDVLGWIDKKAGGDESPAKIGRTITDDIMQHV